MTALGRAGTGVTCALLSGSRGAGGALVRYPPRPPPAPPETGQGWAVSGFCLLVAGPRASAARRGPPADGSPPRAALHRAPGVEDAVTARSAALVSGRPALRGPRCSVPLAFAGRAGGEPACTSPEDTTPHLDLTFVCSSPCGRLSNGSLL